MDPLPWVGALLRELAARETREALLPPHERHAVTAGAGVEALVLTLLPGEQAFSRVAQTPAGDALAGRFHRPRAAAPAHANRWGRAVEALWLTGLARRDGAVISQATPREALALARWPTAAPSLKRDGAEARDEDAAGPRLTDGHRRAHRPARQPRLVGLTVPAEGSPVGGHVTDGHQRDRPAPRCHLTPRRPPLPDLGEPLGGADSQCVAGEPRAVAAAPRCRLVTSGPQPGSLQQALVEAPALSALPRLWAQPGRRQGERAQ